MATNTVKKTTTPAKTTTTAKKTTTPAKTTVKAKPLTPAQKQAAADAKSRAATAKAIPHAALGPLPPGVNPAIARAAQANAERSRLADIQSIDRPGAHDLTSDYSSTMKVAPKLTAVGATLAPPKAAPLVTGPPVAPAPVITPMQQQARSIMFGVPFRGAEPMGARGGMFSGMTPSGESPNGGGFGAGNPFAKTGGFSFPAKTATGFGKVNNPFGFGSGSSGFSWGGSRGGNR